MSISDRLRELARTGAQDISAWILQAIDALGGESHLTVEYLGSVLLDPAADVELRAKAAWIVGLAGERSLTPVLVSLVTSEAPPPLLWEVAKSLCTLESGGEAFHRLVRAGTTSEIRRISAYALGHLREREASADLCRVVRDTSETAAVRGQAAESLGYLGVQSAVPDLLAVLEDPNPEVRYWAVFALGQLEDDRAIPALEAIAQADPSVLPGWGKISEEAAAALCRLRPGPE